MTLFKINYNNEINEIKCNSNDKIIDLKKQIINKFKLKVNYIDLIFEIEIPIRAIGKFNLEKGLMPRTFDDYKLDKWNLENKEINLTFKEIENYQEEHLELLPKIYKNLSSNLELKKTNSPNYELNSNDDFPKLS